MHESQTVERLTTSLEPPSGAPDAKTRRYDRQLRLWAASGQAALRICSHFGHFTLLDSRKVTGADAGNNFFLDGLKSVGKSRAEEAVNGLRELNDGVQGVADTRDIKQVLSSQKDWLKTFDVVVAHNAHPDIIDDLAALLWPETHLLIESHSETAASLRIDKAFPALLEYAMSLPLDTMDITDHAHIPYPVILVRALEEWRRERQQATGAPSTSDEKKAFKERIRKMMRKFDEENFEEAEAQAWRCWTPTVVPSEIQQLFTLYSSSSSSPSSFPALVSALSQFAQNNPASPQYTSGLLPLTSGLPDMKSSTEAIQAEKKVFKEYLSKDVDDASCGYVPQKCACVEGSERERVERNQPGIKGANKLSMQPRETATHLALAAVRFSVGQSARAPSADIPTTAAFLGGLVAQEVIKMITKQYVPISAGDAASSGDGELGVCVVDLVETWTGVI
ncbi:hypothetical protein BT96DRAFT_923957 [Gymnopus androsaceus JB14]|uniref:THIF-type NAD/FAD binding fold domain-containing protein n=1 Tax=Gymnopus androsaceus JB14 TaxID=1447944 RepID=A0A6A4H8S4_9AGAR|nr:hypothetical protein BT96DRAFT_923957 [Gymnopus androsaceus JB14]